MTEVVVPVDCCRDGLNQALCVNEGLTLEFFPKGGLGAFVDVPPSGTLKNTDSSPAIQILGKRRVSCLSKGIAWSQSASNISANSYARLAILPRSRLLHLSNLFYSRNLTITQELLFDQYGAPSSSSSTTRNGMIVSCFSVFRTLFVSFSVCN